MFPRLGFPRLVATTVALFLAFVTAWAAAPAQADDEQARSAYARLVAQIIRARMPVFNPFANRPLRCPIARESAYVFGTVDVPICSASCDFQIDRDGRAHVSSCRGDTREHTAILREAVVNAYFPSPPGGPFRARQSVRFHGKGQNLLFP